MIIIVVREAKKPIGRGDTDRRARIMRTHVEIPTVFVTVGRETIFVYCCCCGCFWSSGPDDCEVVLRKIVERIAYERESSLNVTPAHMYTHTNEH